MSRWAALSAFSIAILALALSIISYLLLRETYPGYTLAAVIVCTIAAFWLFMDLHPIEIKRTLQIAMFLSMLCGVGFVISGLYHIQQFPDGHSDLREAADSHLKIGAMLVGIPFVFIIAGKLFDKLMPPIQ